MTYHIQRDSFRAMCGRTIGTPGAGIYPGVHVERPEFFDTHSYPELIEPATCKACKTAREREAFEGAQLAALKGNERARNARRRIRPGRRAAPLRAVTAAKIVRGFGPAVWAGKAECGHPFKRRVSCKDDPQPRNIRCRRCRCKRAA